MKEFNAIVSEFFKLDPDQISDSLTSKDIPTWDSMNYLLFIAELEKEYDISFSMDEVLNADSLGSIRTLLKSKGASL
jgi:acyl carrier protein